MNAIDLELMRNQLFKSITQQIKKGEDGRNFPSKLNKNKVNGLRAESDLKAYLKSIGHENSMSSGGWLFRSTVGENIHGEKIEFAQNHIALIPELVKSDFVYEKGKLNSNPSSSVISTCQRLFELGVDSYYAYIDNIELREFDFIKDPFEKRVLPFVDWKFKQLGSPRYGEEAQNILEIGENKFKRRKRSYPFLKYETDISSFNDEFIPAIFTSESLRIAFQEMFISESTDFDGIMFGKSDTYPVEIKEKTAAESDKIGEYFGLDLGPFVKLAFFGNRASNLKSIFIVREIDDEKRRNIKQWWVITFEEITRFASFVKMAGGTNMSGGSSAVVMIPKSKFSKLDKKYMDNL